MAIVNTPKPPYYAVIFTSHHTGKEQEEYDKTSAEMVALAQKQSGYLGVESVRSDSGLGITSVYWKDKESIKSWRHHPEHKKANQEGGKIGMNIIKCA